MSNKNMGTITVPIELSARDISFLTTIWNDTDDSELCLFIEGVLKNANKVSSRLAETVTEIEKINPFSHKREFINKKE